jgi:predicted nucleotidyltransferase
MKQLEIIQRLTETIRNSAEIQAAVLYGSFGRGDATANSDVDIQLLVKNEFSSISHLQAIKNTFKHELVSVLHVKLKNKIVIYLRDCPKVELQLCHLYTDFDKYFIGSQILNVNKAILFDATAEDECSLTKYLESLVLKHKPPKHFDNDYINDLACKFIYEFENCSHMHRRGDAFHSYFYYNAAMHAAIQLKHLSLGGQDFNYLPRFMNSKVLPKGELEEFYNLRGTLYLPKFNSRKKLLLDFFTTALEPLVSKDQLREYTQICLSFLERDKLWNFRPTHQFNPKISRRLYRGSTLSIVPDETFFEVLSRYNLSTVIDLRAEREVLAAPYSDDKLEMVRYYHIPFDPWSQPDWFQAKYAYGADNEIAYRFFTLACKEQIAEVMRTLSAESVSNTFIHCHAGKDRTGIICTLLHLLSGADSESIKLDYLASESDTEVKLIEIVLDIVQEEGGIRPYLMSCGLDRGEISELATSIVQ